MGDGFSSLARGDLAGASTGFANFTVLSCVGPGVGVGLLSVDTINNVLVVLFGRWSE